MHSAGSADTGVIGVISDTHGVLRGEAPRIFKGVDLIVHAGDIGSMDILKSLEAIAPVTAVSGNVDDGILRAFLDESETFDFKGFKFHLIHDLCRIDISPEAHGIHMVISGHTHMPELRKKEGVMYLNPGSAGPERPRKPVSLARVTVKDGRLRVRHFNL
jgi:putative phosphoesterase